MRRIFCFFLLFFLTIQGVYAQATLLMTEKSITLEENFALSFVIKSANQSVETPNYKFPELPGLRKLGVSRAKATDIQNGEPVYSFTFSQYYQAVNPGTLLIPTAEVVVNQQSLKVEGFALQVTASEQKEEVVEENKAQIEELFKGQNSVFLALSSTQFQPYVGQGFSLKFSLFIPDDNSTRYSFDRNDIQIPALIQKIRPKNCWEESFGLQEVKVSKVVYKNKKYTEYRFFQSTYFALDAKKIFIPALSLYLLKNSEKVTFSSKPLVISPKELPNHPLKGKVPVGDFHLEESVSRNTLVTGDSVIYLSSVIGDGNSILWESKLTESDYFLNFLPLGSQSSVFPYGDKMLGNKTEKILIIPSQPGKFALKSYFNWIYFNTRTATYDTLHSGIVLTVSGQPSDRLLNTQSETMLLYRGLEKLTAEKVIGYRWMDWRLIFNILLGLLILWLVFLMIKAKK
ncbi:BatD family protein [Aquirufa sp. HETE-83D]|uniref:BatD family protein n=1 Tax=Aquirufa esocilacus TaxID=3096513 RepID=A0ABW6DN25_9BACT